MRDKTNVKAVYDILKRKILYCEFQPGQVVSEKEIVEELNTSRTPVREALKILSGEGLLKILPKKGIQIAALSPKKILEIYEIRSVLEPLSVRQAMRYIKPEDIEYLTSLDQKLSDSLNRQDILEVFRIGMDFHLHIAHVTKNETLFTILKGLRDQNYRGFVYYLKQYLDGCLDDEKNSIITLLRNGHRNLFNALQERDEEKAVRFISEDMEGMNKLIKQFCV